MIIENHLAGKTIDRFISNRSRELLFHININFVDIIGLDSISSLSDDLNIRLNNIKHNPLIKLTKGYRLVANNRFEYQKTIKWRDQHVGQGLNKCVDKRLQFDLDCGENQYLKYCVLQINNCLSYLLKNNKKMIYDLDEKIMLLDQEITKETTQLNYNYISKRVLKNSYNVSYYANKDLNELQEIRENIIRVNKKLNSTKIVVNDLILNDFLKNISINAFNKSIRLMNNNNYARINEIKDILSGKMKDLNKQNVIKGQTKKTSELYELFLLVCIFQILKNAGYQAIKNYALLTDNLENRTFEYIKNQEHIYIQYNCLVLNNSNLGNYNRYATLKNRPDIIIIIIIARFVDDKFYAATILEAKCRQEKYVYDSKYETDAENQIKQYTTYKFIDKNNQLIETPIIKVAVVCPATRLMESKFFNKLNFIGLLPDNDKISSKSLEYLRNYLYDTLKF